MYPDFTSNTPVSLENTASRHQKHPPQKYALRNFGRFGTSLTNRIESELTQWRTFLSVSRSQTNTWPRCPPHPLQVISVRIPSASALHSTRPGMASSKLGHPHPESNLESERKSGDPHWRQTKAPFSWCETYSPENGASVPLRSMTRASSSVRRLRFRAFINLMVRGGLGFRT